MPYRSDDQQGIDFIMVCDDVSGEPRLAEPERCDDVRWFGVDALPPNTAPYIERAIAMTRRGDWFLEFSEPISSRRFSPAMTLLQSCAARGHLF